MEEGFIHPDKRCFNCTFFDVECIRAPLNCTVTEFWGCHVCKHVLQYYCASLTLSTVAEGCRELRVVGHDRDGWDACWEALDAGRLAWRGSECRRRGQAALHTTHRWCREGKPGGNTNTFIQKKEKEKSNRGHFFLSQSHSVVQVIALMFHSIHISPTNVPLHPNAEDYFLLIFRFRQHSLHLQSLFTTTFNLPGTADKLSLAQGDNSHATVRRVQTN